MLARACGFDSRLAHHKKGHDVSRVLFCGFRRPQGGSTLRDFNARGGRAAPAPRFCLGQNARTAHPRRRPEGRLGGSLLRVRIIARISNIHFDRPFLWTPRAEGPLHPSGFQCSGRQSHPCAEVLPVAKRSYGAPAPPARRPVGGSSATVPSTKKASAKQMPFLWITPPISALRAAAERRLRAQRARVLAWSANACAVRRRGQLSVRTWPSGPGYQPGAGRRRRAGRGRPVP